MSTVLLARLKIVCHSVTGTASLIHVVTHLSALRNGNWYGYIDTDAFILYFILPYWFLSSVETVDLRRRLVVQHSFNDLSHLSSWYEIRPVSITGIKKLLLCWIGVFGTCSELEWTLVTRPYSGGRPSAGDEVNTPFLIMLQKPFQWLSRDEQGGVFSEMLRHTKTWFLFRINWFTCVPSVLFNGWTEFLNNQWRRKMSFYMFGRSFTTGWTPAPTMTNVRTTVTQQHRWGDTCSTGVKQVNKTMNIHSKPVRLNLKKLAITLPSVLAVFKLRGCFSFSEDIIT